jgi:membrane fusion protein (multidrug efflux system)
MLSLVSVVGVLSISTSLVGAEGNPSAQSDIVGTVVAARVGDISPWVDGMVNKIHFFPGQMVKKGDLLIEFYTVDKDLRLKGDRANRERAEAELRNAEINLENNKQLRAKNVISELKLRELEVARDIAAANLKYAKTAEEGGEYNLSVLKRFAPFDGMMGESRIREGEFVTKESRQVSTLATIIQMDPIWVRGQASFEIYRGLREIFKTDEAAAEQTEVRLIFPNGEKYPHVGHIVAGGHEFDEATQKIVFLAEFPNPTYLLRPGLRVRLELARKQN